MTSTVSKALRNRVAERDSYTCILCDKAYSDIHHLIPRSRGGRNVVHNLVCLCRDCHNVAHGLASGNSRSQKEYANFLILQYLSDYYAEDSDFYNDLWKAHML